MNTLRTVKTQDKLGFFEVENLGGFLSQFDRLCVERFLEWLKNKKDWWVVLEREGVEGIRYYKRDFRFFRVYNRFDRQYVKRVIRRFRKVKYFAEEHSFVHIELTVKHEGSISESIKLLRKNWNRLRALLKKRLGHNYPFVDFIEPCKDGYPHLHILYFTKKFVITHEELSRWCEEHGLGYVVWLRRYWACGGYRKKPIYYFAKYLTKQYKKEKWSFGDFVFHACIWFLGCKTYTYSQKEFELCKRKLKGWKVYVLSYEELIMTIKLNVKIGIWSFSPPLEYFEWDLRNKILWCYGRKQ